ncbi:Uncharacterized protein TCAP_03385 [Tolypocladium capitatum]|uniref:Alcohol acetyltransferase FCK4 n=1 Tax=Tolypocladium capitatum TaxID=45235 RepID=A0A2K3QGL9_9HYPO|nr:Uncharacterized protein TCAP_03385 [Tolypocladium capitatum]
MDVAAAQDIPGTIRPVGSSAKFNTSRHHLGLCRCVVLTGHYAVSHQSTLAGAKDGSSVRDAVVKALATVVSQHPMLRVGIVGEGSAEPVYIHLLSIDLRQVMQWKEFNGQDGDDYTAFLLHSVQAQHDQVWEHLDARPAWKIIVHQPSSVPSQAPGIVHLDISFAFHHAIGDAESAVIFHRDLLRALNGARPPQAAPALNDHILALKSQAHLPRPLEAIVPLNISWLYLCAFILLRVWSKLAPSRLKSKDPWTSKNVSIKTFKTNLRLVHVPYRTIASLITTCREKGTTLTPLLHGLILASLSNRLRAIPANAFCANTPISLRRFAAPDFNRQDTIHCLVTAHSFLFNTEFVSEFRKASKNNSESMVWRAAVDLGKNLRSKVARLPRNDQMGLLGWVSDWETFWLQQIGKPRKDSWSCSNAGSLGASDAGSLEGDRAHSGRWGIERLIFSQGALPMGSTFNVNVVGVQGKSLSITLSWQDTILDSSLMDGLAEDLQTWLDQFGKSGSFGLSAQ